MHSDNAFNGGIFVFGFLEVLDAGTPANRQVCPALNGAGHKGATHFSASHYFNHHQKIWVVTSRLSRARLRFDFVLKRSMGCRPNQWEGEE